MDAPDDVETFLRLELQVWDALVRGDAAADARLLADDFVGVYPTGITDRDGHVGQLAGGPTVASFELSEVDVVVLSDTAALLYYRADWRRARSGEHGEHGEPEAMYVSSLWCRRDGEWLNVFSQDTPTPA